MPDQSEPPPLGLGVQGVAALVEPAGAAASSSAPSSSSFNPASAAEVTSPLELTHFVDTLLTDLETRFDTMSQDVLARLHSLSTRVDSLESSLADLMSGSTPPVGPTVPASSSPTTSSS